MLDGTDSPKENSLTEALHLKYKGTLVDDIGASNRGAFVLAAMNLLTSFVSFVLAWYSFNFVAEAYRYGDVVLTDMPAWMFQSILPLAFFLLGYRYLVWTARRTIIFFRFAGNGT